MGDAVAHLEGLGVNTEGIRGRASTRKRGRSLGPAAGDDDGDDEGMDVDGEGGKRVSFFFLLISFFPFVLFFRGGELVSGLIFHPRCVSFDGFFFLSQCIFSLLRSVFLFPSPCVSFREYIRFFFFSSHHVCLFGEGFVSFSCFSPRVCSGVWSGLPLVVSLHAALVCACSAGIFIPHGILRVSA